MARTVDPTELIPGIAAAEGCPKCGEPAEGAMRFCSHCGTELDGSPPAEEAAAAPVTETLSCGGCGAEVSFPPGELSVGPSEPRTSSITNSVHTGQPSRCPWMRARAPASRRRSTKSKTRFSSGQGSADTAVTPTRPPR